MGTRGVARQISTATLMRKIARLPPVLPVTARFERALTKQGSWSREGVWYRSQKQHWTGWLSEYQSPGAYGRKGGDNRDAEFTYNHIVCPPMLLWLAEASGVPQDVLSRAVRDALAASPSLPSKCAAVRRNVPWSSIAPRLRL